MVDCQLPYSQRGWTVEWSTESTSGIQMRIHLTRIIYVWIRLHRVTHQLPRGHSERPLQISNIDIR